MVGRPGTRGIQLSKSPCLRLGYRQNAAPVSDPVYRRSLQDADYYRQATPSKGLEDPRFFPSLDLFPVHHDAGLCRARRLGAILVRHQDLSAFPLHPCVDQHPGEALFPHRNHRRLHRNRCCQRGSVCAPHGLFTPCVRSAFDSICRKQRLRHRCSHQHPLAVDRVPGVFTQMGQKSSIARDRSLLRELHLFLVPRRAPGHGSAGLHAHLAQQAQVPCHTAAGRRDDRSRADVARKVVCTHADP